MKTSWRYEPKAMVHGPGASLNELTVKLLLNRVADDIGIVAGGFPIGTEMLQRQDNASTIQ
jgi:hypothetical protein